MGDSSPLAHSPTLAATSPRGEDSAKLEAGAKVGEYVIERFIGAGAMGEVYAGRHPVIGKRVAIKILRNDLAASAEAAERFIREARAVNQIEHENVVDVFAFGRLDDGRMYLVMDLVEGKSLRAALVNGPLDVTQALAILETISEALDTAHAKGVVHRDLKPDNVVLSNATPPKVFVLDFGIAKLISTANAGEQTGPGTLTGQGTWLGTPSYMAPEQWSVDGAGPASDRYALGVIAFELLAGAPPFSATSVPGMMEQHFRAEVPALAAKGGDGLPSALDAVLKRALAKDPDARYPTAREFVSALRDAAGTTAHKARGAVAPPAASKKLLVPALAGVALLGGALAVVITSRKDDKPAPAARPIADDPKAGVAIDVVSTPMGADVKVGDEVKGKTPTQIRAKPGETLELAITKPGYLPETRTVTVQQSGNQVKVSLGEVIAFQGVWKLSNGELRAFQRNGEQVDVFKLHEVAGAREFFKHYDFVPATAGIAFAAEDKIIDPRAPNDPNCHVRVRVEYLYDPAKDVLEQRRDVVKLDVQDGHCVVRSRKIEPTYLARVDRDSHDAVDIPAPVGKPVNAEKKPVKPAPKEGKTIPLDPKRQLEQQKKLEAAKQAEAKNVKAPPSKNPEPPPQQNAAPQPVKGKGKLPPKQQAEQQQAPDNDFGGQVNQPSPQSQIAPQPQPSAPQMSAEPQQTRTKN